MTDQAAKPPPTDLEALLAKAHEATGARYLDIDSHADGGVSIAWLARDGFASGAAGDSLEAALRQVIEEEETHG